MLINPILRFEKEKPEAPCLYRLQGDQWICFSRADVVDAVYRLCTQWQSDGLIPGQRVLVLMENRPEWAVTAIACSLYGLVLVPAYTTHREHEIDYLLDKSQASAVVISDGELSNRLKSVDSAMQLLWYAADNQSNILFSKLTQRNDEISINQDPDSLYALIPTSGTNGQPKLVELTQNNIFVNVTSILTVLRDARIDQPHRFLSFLPLAHAYEHMAGLYLPFHLGGEIFYCERLDKLASLMADVKPTLMTAVPRLYELLYGRITAQVTKSGGFKQRLFQAAINLGNQSKLTFKDHCINWICERLVRNKVRKRFGGRLQYFVSGGAALNPEISRFFRGLGVGILQGYGQTEASPVISVNRPGSARAETVGPALPDIEVRLTDEGELLVRGENVMRGYWRDPEATEATIREGWLYTGDLAQIDPDGHIRIIGRLKDLIVNSGGDNIAPAPIEQEITLYPEVDQVIIVGDGKPSLSALICLNNDFETTDPDTSIVSILKRYNVNKPPLLQVRKGLLMSEPCTIENGLLTPTQKIKRSLVVERYQEAIDDLY
jgi:long-chain acyl-CoA synthetase